MARRSDAWFRSPAWTPEARALFERELARSRSDLLKAQYVKIKGLALSESPDPSAQAAGVDLLWRVGRDYPAQWHQVAHSHKLLGDYFARVGDLASAEARYRYVKEKSEHADYLVDLELAEVLVRRGDEQALREALQLVDSYVGGHKGGHFKQELYRINLVAARVLQRLGSLDQAQSHALKVLELMDDREPDLPRHPTFGLAPKDNAVRAEMLALVESR